MGISSSQQINKILSQMGLDRHGVKRGSVFVPLLAIFVMLLAFLAWVVPMDKAHDRLDRVFEKLCTLAKQPNPPALAEAKKGRAPPLREECIRAPDLQAVPAITDKFRARKTADAKIDEVNAFWTREMSLQPSLAWEATEGSALAAFADSRRFAWGLADVQFLIATATTLATLALLALIPGLAGLIYRRNFWGWFVVAFVLMFLIDASQVFGRRIVETKNVDGDALIFVVSQLIILLLAMRLRRYSDGAVIGTTKLHNRLLSMALTAVAFACLVGWPKIGGESIWSFVQLDETLYKWEFILIGLPVIYSLLRKSILWAGTKPKNIVVCLDGTSNTPDQYEAGLLAQTNVFKLFQMLKPTDGQGIIKSGRFDASLTKAYDDKQIGFYYTGVGNKFENDPIAQMLGQATGMGASEVVNRAYLDITRVYRPGDRIYIFGFSRGAAIARLLARAVNSRGAPRAIWTLRLFGRHWLIWKSKRDKRADASKPVPIAVLGCWDTVGAFGIAKTIAGINFQKIDLFKDLTVPENVERAYHMVAMDEQRDSFVPTLMEPDPIHPERIVEVWFCGDHANVGGGWGTPKLSDVTMDFLLKHVSSGYADAAAKTPGAEDWGIYLNAYNGAAVKAEGPAFDGATAIHPDPLGQLRHWNSVLYDYAPRKMPVHAVISDTVFERMTNSVPVYAPQSLFNHNEELDEKRDKVTAHIARLKDTESLSDDEQKAVLKFMGRLRLTRWSKYAEDLEAQLEKEQRLSTVLPKSRLANPPPQPALVAG